MKSEAVAAVLVCAREAAAALGISERTLWTETKAGRIRCCRIGARVLYRPETLAEYAAANEVDADPFNAGA